MVVMYLYSFPLKQELYPLILNKTRAKTPLGRRRQKANELESETRTIEKEPTNGAPTKPKGKGKKK